MSEEQLPGFGSMVAGPISKKKEPEFPPIEFRDEASFKDVLKSAGEELRAKEKNKLNKPGFFGVGAFLAGFKEGVFSKLDKIIEALKTISYNEGVILEAIRAPKELEIKKLKDQILEERTIAVSHAAEADELRNKLERANSILKKVAETSILLNAENAFELFMRGLKGQEIDLTPLKSNVNAIQEEIKSLFVS